MKLKRHRILGGLAIAVASVGVAAPVAQADDWYNDSGTAIVRPDDRAGARGPLVLHRSGYVVDPGYVRPDDRAGAHGPGSAPAATPAHIVVSPTGFDWTDAGIGAGMAFGLILLGSGMLLVARRHRKPTAAV
jgi:hypothetical protein